MYSPIVYETGDIIDTMVYRLGLENAKYGPAARGQHLQIGGFDAVYLRILLCSGQIFRLSSVLIFGYLRKKGEIPHDVDSEKQPRVRAKNHIKESTGRKVFRIVNAVVLTALALICLLPFVNVIAISFSNSFYVDSNQVYFWPKGWTVNAYTYILTRASFWTSFRTSILRVLLGGGLNLFFIILTAYPLSKSNDKLHFRNVYTWYFFITMLVSGGMIPNYLLIAKLGLRDTLWSLVLPGALPVFNLVLMLNFFRQVPTALEEAALIDGAGHLRTLVQIYLPVSCSPLRPLRFSVLSAIGMPGLTA